MPEQLSLPGFDNALPKKPLIDQIFFAIRPDEEPAARIAEIVRRLCREHGLSGKPLPPERLHVTLRGLGGYDGTSQEVVSAAKDAAAAIAMPPFNVAFNSVMSFGGGLRKRPLVLCGDDGVAGLLELQRALGVAMTKVGLGRFASSQYTPHMTLLYDERSVAKQAIETFVWPVREFVLVHSLVGQARHEVLARWPLRG
jgi:2'-5' RNA ligase